MLRIFIVFISYLFVSSALSETIEGTSFSEYNVRDKIGREITYYLSKSTTKEAPLLLMIQGSGCNRVFNKSPAGVYSTIFNLTNIANENKFSVMAVEKPFSGVKIDAKGDSVEFDCTKDFHQDFTVESWTQTLTMAMTEAIKKLGYRPRKILLFGQSEGAGIASELAAINTSVTHVITTGGSGTTQLYDFVVFAYQNCFNRSACVEQAYVQLDDISKDPQSVTRFAWGHPYKRWSSFFRLDPAENFMKSNAKIYVMFGTADVATPALSQEIIAAKLKSSDKDITVRRIPDANHMLQYSNHSNLDDLDKEYRLAFDWFWSSITNDH